MGGGASSQASFKLCEALKQNKDDDILAGIPKMSVALFVKMSHDKRVPLNVAASLGKTAVLFAMLDRDGGKKHPRTWDASWKPKELKDAMKNNRRLEKKRRIKKQASTSTRSR